MLRDREFYRTRDIADLKQRLKMAKDRETRADTAEAALAEAFTIQEICAVLSERDIF